MQQIKEENSENIVRRKNRAERQERVKITLRTATYTFASSFVAYVTLTTAVSDSVLTEGEQRETNVWVTMWENITRGASVLNHINLLSFSPPHPPYSLSYKMFSRTSY